MIFLSLNYISFHFLDDTFDMLWEETNSLTHVQTYRVYKVMMITNNNIGGYDGKGIYTSRHSHNFLAFRLDWLYYIQSVCLRLLYDKHLWWLDDYSFLPFFLGIACKYVMNYIPRTFELWRYYEMKFIYSKAFKIHVINSKLKNFISIWLY